MKSSLGILAVVFTALACGLAFSQNPPAQTPPAPSTEKWEKELAAARLRFEALASEVADLRKQMAATQKYLEAQAKSAGSMMEVLDESEKAGFTYGLNPNSRHIMLRGWRDQLTTAQKDVPGRADSGATGEQPSDAPMQGPPKPGEKTAEKSQEK